ncbi:MAG: TlpA family protein disulfide reductase [Actinomycetia bacterium]|nr:TlpA family protein disulfide reductase [Actinomycetes bacterium]
MLVAIGSSTGSEGSAVDAVNEPTPATNVAMQDFDGNAMTISELEGQPVVVNFWASWCAPCLAEMPGFERVYQSHRDSVQFLGVNLTDDLDPALQVVAETGVTYPLARDTQGETFTAFGGFGMPTTVFLDESGGVIEMYTGELTAGELEARIVEYFEDS